MCVCRLKEPFLCLIRCLLLLALHLLKFGEISETLHSYLCLVLRIYMVHGLMGLTHLCTDKAQHCRSENSRGALLPRLRWISFGGAVHLSGVADCPTLDSKGEIGGPTSAYSLHITPAHLAHWYFSEPFFFWEVFLKNDAQKLQSGTPVG